MHAVSMANCSSLNFLGTSSSSAPVSTAALGCIAPVIYIVAIGTKSNVFTSPNVVPVLTSSTSPSLDAGSSVTSALMQWLAGMQQNKASSSVRSSAPEELVNLSPSETTLGPLRNSPVTEATVREPVSKKKLVNVNVRVLSSGKLKDCPIYVPRNIDDTKFSTQRELIKELQNQF